VRFVGHGHPAIRATHGKTLEIISDAAITERATCVVAVGARSEPPQPLAGPVRITITAGGASFTLDALANPLWDPSGPAVIRRSPLRLPGTLATGASAAAADLPRPLATALADPAADVEVLVEPAPTTPAVVLFAADAARPADPTLAAEVAAADLVVAEDAAARRLVPLSSAVPDAQRVLLVAAVDLPGRALTGSDPAIAPSIARAAGHAIEVIGLPGPLAVAAACPSRAPLTIAPADSDPRTVLRAVPSTHRLVLTVPHDRVAGLLADAAAHRGQGRASVAQDFGPVLAAAPDAIPAPATHDDVHVCLHPAPPGDDLDPRVRSALAALVEDGVPTRTTARALAELTGWPRRRAYDAALEFVKNR
jgi:hypothetical protein